MIHIEHKIYLYALLLLPLLWLCFVGVMLWKKKAHRKFAQKQALQRLMPERSSFKPWVKFFLLEVILALILIALANPKVGTQLQTVKRQGVDMVFAVDVSKSMLAQDVKPSRLERAKRIVSEVMNQLHSDRVGLVPYAGQAYAQLPLTSDYAAAKMFLQSLNTQMLSSQGTAIKEALLVGANYFKEDAQGARLLFVLSDGEDHEQGAQEVAEQIREKGIKIYTIGIGTQKGGTIPEKQNGQSPTYKRDENGEVVITRLNPDLLKEIAQETSGEYFEGNNTQQTTQKIEQILQGLEKNEYEQQVFSDYQDQFQWFIAAALLVLALDFFVSFKKTAWVQKLNLFNEKK